MSQLNNVRFNPTLGGMTDWTFSSVVASLAYQTPAQAGAINAATYTYFAVSADFSQWEIGRGAYNTGTGVLSRTTVLYNSSATGTASGQSGAGTKINFSTVPQVAIVTLADDIADGPWIAYTPTITAGSGTFTTVSATGRYKIVGTKTIHTQIDVTITAIGTAGGNIVATLPFTAAAFNFAGSAREHATTGKGGSCFIAASGTTITATDASASTFIGNGAQVVFGATYEVP